MESVGISLGKQAGIGNSRNGTREHSSLSFYFSKIDPDQIRSVAHVHGASSDISDWILSNRQVRTPDLVAN
jgi:hypothetical protein